MTMSDCGLAGTTFGTFDDYLIVPTYSSIKSRSEVDTSWSLGGEKFSIPVIASNMDSICGEKMAIQMAHLGGLGIIHRYMSISDYHKITGRWRRDPFTTERPLALSVGSIYNDKERINACCGQGGLADIVCIDIAHGHSMHMSDTIKYIRDLGYINPIIAGNVATSSGAKELLSWGADMVKVGIGGGAACSTRIKTGVGVPQLSAIARAKLGLNTFYDDTPMNLIADGGIKTPGDAAKALAAGASCIMIGGMLAGTDCTPFWTSEGEDTVYRGMASREARKDFGQTGGNAEGVSYTVKCLEEGSTSRVINDIVEGVRSAMSYTNSRNLKDFYRNAELQRVSPSASRENAPHLTS